ncbi:hypothetical protein P4V41_07200 [Fictibacillus nanhaiensis]|uniref:hypothetical protein n=1 Tax=Fictibacillus nanhaiensis TaxID=742169 RepID=UPI002E1C4AC4|nr:hypothetical protein [Fictibacillus nanhaiensis]
MDKTNKKLLCQLQLNEIKQSVDPTAIPCTFIILDFEKSWNNAIVTKDVALEFAPTINNKPIVAKYHRVDEANTKTDAFGGHELTLAENKHGNLAFEMDTVPIGTFTSEGYIIEIGEGEEKREVLAADAILWKSRFSDACDLLLEWYSRGININTSCEFLYSNFTVEDGIEYIRSPIYFEGHAVLNSEERGEHEVVLPAYDSSKLLSFNELNKFNKLVAQAVNQKKEAETMPDMFKKVFELSHSDIRSKLYQALDAQLGEGYWTWIIDSFDDRFIVSIESEEEYKQYQYNYVKNEDDTVAIDFDSKVEVVEERKWVALEKTQELQSELNSAKEELETTKTQLNEANTSLETLKTEKAYVEVKFGEATETITSLNSKVEELTPFKEQVEKEQLEKALNEKSEIYKAKFEAVNAVSEFESEEVQDLIKLSLNESEEGKNAIFQLNSKLVDLVVLPKKEDSTIRETASKRENLIPTSDSFESRYSL